MATANFAIPLNNNSKQTGDVTFQVLKENQANVTFQLTDAGSGTTNVLDLITSKGGQTKHHKYNLTFFGSKTSTDVSASEIGKIFDDANGGDWDYVQAQWTVGITGQSNQYEIQSGQTYDSNGWPPKD